MVWSKLTTDSKIIENTGKGLSSAVDKLWLTMRTFVSFNWHIHHLRSHFPSTTTMAVIYCTHPKPFQQFPFPQPFATKVGEVLDFPHILPIPQLSPTNLDHSQHPSLWWGVNLPTYFSLYLNCHNLPSWYSLTPSLHPLPTSFSLYHYCHPPELPQSLPFLITKVEGVAACPVVFVAGAAGGPEGVWSWSPPVR